ncbi:Antiactivator FleN [Candidatus Magnetomoraceae bacterium gMMP-15]
MDQASGLRQLIKQRSDDIADKQDNAVAGSYLRTIAVTSGKGGVGKTNIVGNLAIAFRKLGKKVLIFDGDLGLANVDILFGVRPVYNIKHVLNGEKSLAETIIEGPEKILIIPGGSGIQDLLNLTEGQKMNLLSEFEGLNKKTDIFLVDTGAGISTNTTCFNMAAEERIVISTPEPTSITDAYALMKVMFLKHKIKDFKLLVNMAANEKEAIGIYNNLKNGITRFLKDISLKYIGFIPRDEYILKSVRKQSPVMVSYPESASGKSFYRLAKYLINETKETSGKTISSFWQKFMLNL